MRLTSQKLLDIISRLKHRLPLIGVFFIIACYASAQPFLSPNLKPIANKKDKNEQVKKEKSIEKNSVQSQTDSTKTNSKMIEIIWADHYIKRKNFKPHVLKDSVQFLHQGAYLNCDSAYYDEDGNSFEAFNDVKMNQGDTLFLYGDYMNYDGTKRLAKVRKNVKLEHGSGTLFTDSLDYDRVSNISYYFNGAILLDSVNKLTSYWGQYEPNFKLATFKDSVVLHNPNFNLYTEVLKYNTDTKIATITAPTKIVSDSGTIYTDRGFYNTITEKSIFLDQSKIVNKTGNQILKGDSIVYDKTRGIGKVYGHMFLQDTIKHVILKGNYGYYNQITGNALATDSAECLEYSQGDTLYIHADTVKLLTINVTDSLKADSIKQKTILKISNRKDSLILLSKDSTSIHKMKNSVLAARKKIAVPELKKDGRLVPIQQYLANPYSLESLIDRYMPIEKNSSIEALIVHDQLPKKEKKKKVEKKPQKKKKEKEQKKSSKKEKVKKVDIPVSKTTQQSDSTLIKNSADSLKSINVDQSKIKRPVPKRAKTAKDSIKQQSPYHLILGYHNVRFYRNDMQGVCDSMQFSSTDSVLHMFRDPVIWSDKHQLTGDTINIYMTDSSTIDRMHVINNSFSIEQKDTLHYNQLKGRELTMYFEGRTTKQVYAEGNVESNVYPEDKNNNMVGVMNHLECSFLRIYMHKGVFEKLVAWPKPVGSTTPFSLLSDAELRLKNFYWLDYLRPKDKNDIFRKVSRKAGDTGPKRLAIFDEEE